MRSFLFYNLTLNKFDNFVQMDVYIYGCVDNNPFYSKEVVNANWQHNV